MEFTKFEEKRILEQSMLSERVIGIARAAYASEGRYYHNWQHALNVLSWVNNLPISSPQFTIAAMFHDAIYTHKGSPSNEAQSANLVSKTFFDDVQDVSEDTISCDTILCANELIMLTARHGKLESSDVSEWSALFLDCDMASFGENRWEIVSWNEENIQQELFLQYSKELVKVGRMNFLQGLLSKKSVFLSDYFKIRYESQARENIHRLIQNL